MAKAPKITKNSKMPKGLGPRGKQLFILIKSQKEALACTRKGLKRCQKIGDKIKKGKKRKASRSSDPCPGICAAISQKLGELAGLEAQQSAVLAELDTLWGDYWANNCDC